MWSSAKGSAALLRLPALQSGFIAGFSFSVGMSGLSQVIPDPVFLLLSEVSYMTEKKEKVVKPEK